MDPPRRLSLQETYRNLNALSNTGRTVLFSTLRNYIYANSEAGDNAASRLSIRDSAYQNRQVLQDVPFSNTYGSSPGAHVVVADLETSSLLTIKYESERPFRTMGDIEMLDGTLSQRAEHVQGRIIFTSVVSGVSTIKRRSAQHDSMKFTELAPGSLRTPVALGVNFSSENSNPNIQLLSTIARHTTPDPDLILRYIYDTTHLTDKACLRKGHILDCGRKKSPWKELHIRVDGRNQFFVAIKRQINEGPWTMLILAIENNCMGLDLHTEALVTEQPLQAFPTNPTKTFSNLLKTVSSTDCGKIKIDPVLLVSLYSDSFISAFAAHVELYHRNWSQSYEPWARSSTIYGYAEHREVVRRLSRTHSTYLRSLRHTIDGLKSSLQEHSDSVKNQLLNPMIDDFQRFFNEINLLKTDCDQFLEQQVGKVALQETRLQMREARDVKSLTYFAFIFVPLSLASSFFGMNVKELDSGSTPVWLFVVVALGLLVVSLFGTWLAARIARKEANSSTISDPQTTSKNASRRHETEPRYIPGTTYTGRRA